MDEIETAMIGVKLLTNEARSGSEIARSLLCDILARIDADLKSNPLGGPSEIPLETDEQRRDAQLSHRQSELIDTSPMPRRRRDGRVIPKYLR